MGFTHPDPPITVYVPISVKPPPHPIIRHETHNSANGYYTTLRMIVQ